MKHRRGRRCNRQGDQYSLAVAAAAGGLSAGAQSSGVVLNADNLLWKLTRPTVPDEDGSTYEMLYQTGATGSLTNFLDPRGKEHRFQYNTDTGKLEFDRDPLTLSGTAFKTLTRTPLSSGNGYEVAVTTNAGLTTKYAVESLDTGDRSWTMSWPNNTRTVVSTTKPDESSTITYPDSTVAKVTKRPDPIFGTMASTGARLRISLSRQSPPESRKPWLRFEPGSRRPLMVNGLHP